MICKGCNGKGFYIGLRWVEDPCSRCGGTGRADGVGDLNHVISEIEEWFRHITSETHALAANKDNTGLIRTQKGELIGVSRETGRFYVFTSTGELRVQSQSYDKEAIEAGIEAMVQSWSHWLQLGYYPDEIRGRRFD